MKTFADPIRGPEILMILSRPTTYRPRSDDEGAAAGMAGAGGRSIETKSRRRKVCCILYITRDICSIDLLCIYICTNTVGQAPPQVLRGPALHQAQGRGAPAPDHAPLPRKYTFIYIPNKTQTRTYDRAHHHHHVYINVTGRPALPHPPRAGLGGEGPAHGALPPPLPAVRPCT